LKAFGRTQSKRPWSGVIRSFGKACTGNETLGLLLSLDKWQSKTLLAAAGIPTPQGLIVPPGQSIPTRTCLRDRTSSTRPGRCQ